MTLSNKQVNIEQNPNAPHRNEAAGGNAGIRISKKVRKRTEVSSIAMLLTFLAFILTFFVLICVLPKHEGELSPNERRTLAEAPDFSLENILSGDFASETEAWLEDHFPLRNFFVSLYSYVNRFTGRNTTSSVIAGANGRIFSDPVPLNEEQIRINAENIGNFLSENNLNAYFAIIPSAGYMLEEDLPSLHREYKDDEIIELFVDTLNQETSEASGDKLQHIDVETVFSGKYPADDCYYRTDHHLTMDGTYALYTELSAQLNYEPLGEDKFTKAAYEFYGTAYGGSGLALTKPDTLEVWTRDEQKDIMVTTIDGNQTAEHMGLYDETCLADDYVDKYATYLYSNHGLTYVENPNAEERTLLVLKDSYGNALVPFLSEHFSTIVMIDVRYYSPVMELPSDIVEKLGITDFLVIYGTDTIAETRDLGWLM